MKLINTPPIDTSKVPKDPSERRDWITIQLKRRGVSLRRLSMDAGFNPNYARQALYQPMHSAEVLIATALGTTPQALWPERHDLEGQRLHATRPMKSISHEHTGNVKNRRAA